MHVRRAHSSFTYTFWKISAIVHQPPAHQSASRTCAWQRREQAFENKHQRVKYSWERKPRRTNGDNTIVHIIHCSAVNPVNWTEILLVILPMSAGGLISSINSWISWRFRSLHSLSIFLAVPRNRLCIGSTWQVVVLASRRSDLANLHGLNQRLCSPFRSVCWLSLYLTTAWECSRWSFPAHDIGGPCSHLYPRLGRGQYALNWLLI